MTTLGQKESLCRGWAYIAAWLYNYLVIFVPSFLRPFPDRGDMGKVRPGRQSKPVLACPGVLCGRRGASGVRASGQAGQAGQAGRAW